MPTTIQITESLRDTLTSRKLFDRETYEEVIWDLIEDTMELNDETKREIARSRIEFEEGKVHTLADVKKELDL